MACRSVSIIFILICLCQLWFQQNQRRATAIARTALWHPYCSQSCTAHDAGSCAAGNHEVAQVAPATAHYRLQECNSWCRQRLLMWEKIGLRIISLAAKTWMLWTPWNRCYRCTTLIGSGSLAPVVYPIGTLHTTCHVMLAAWRQQFGCQTLDMPRWCLRKKDCIVSFHICAK